MKVYKATPKIELDDAIIKDGNKYRVTSRGEYLGTIIVDQDTAFQIENIKDYTTVAELFQIPKEELYVSGNVGNISYGTTTDSNYHLEVFKKRKVNELPYGVFEMKASMNLGTYLQEYKSSMGKPILIPTHNLRSIVDEFYAEEGTGRKRKKGVLTYGPPGNGKTSDIITLFEKAVENKERIILVSSNVQLDDLNEYRGILEEDKTIFVIEEITERLGRRGVEDVLTFMDGENSWNNSMTFATTNHPEDMPSNLIDRPGRFELFLEYKNPTKEQILELAASFDIEGAETLVGQNLSFDYVSFILSLAKKSGISVKDARDKEEQKRKRLSSTFKGKIGIGM